MSGDATVRVLHQLCESSGMTGVETFVLQLGTAQRRLGLEPHLSLEVPGREPLVEEALLAGLPVHPGPLRDAREATLPRPLDAARRHARRVAALVRVLRRERIDVLHLHAVGIAGLDAFAAAALARVPVVVTHHATPGWSGPVRRPVERATFRLERWLARRVVMPYAAAADALVAMGVRPDRVRVLPLCIDTERFPLRGGRTAPQDPFRLVIVSRVLERRGHAELLEAMALLRKRLPRLRLRIIGDGPLRPEILARAAAMGLSEQVEWSGWVDHADVPALLAGGDAVALPSCMPAETFPLALVEGMALGLPAIGARWAGIPDVLGDGGAGMVVEPRDVAGLAEAIATLALDASAYARASAAAVARVRAHFTGHAVARAHHQLYAEALGRAVPVALPARAVAV